MAGFELEVFNCTILNIMLAKDKLHRFLCICYVIVTEIAEIGWIYYICSLFPPTFSISRFHGGKLLKENIW